jgi:hypothetical protein
MEVRLQPLRVPSGWNVEYNDGFYEIDPIPELVSEDDRGFFKEDLLQMKHPQFNRLLDVGWYPERNLADGHYRLVVYEGDFRGRLMHEFRIRDRLTLVAEIERLLVMISNGKL